MQTIKNKKNAQILGQVVMFLLAGIVFVLVLIYGYKAITQFLEKSEDVGLATFQNDLLTAVESIKRDYGTVIKTELSLPPKYGLLCIADSDSTKPSTDFEQMHKRMYAAWQTGSENIFLTPPSTQPIKKIEDITVDGGYFCIKNTGKVVLRLEGMGDKAKVSQWG